MVVVDLVVVQGGGVDAQAVGAARVVPRESAHVVLLGEGLLVFALLAADCAVTPAALDDFPYPPAALVDYKG